MLAALSNAPGDGSINMLVDAMGAFGSQLGPFGGDAIFDPIGDDPDGTIFESAVAIGFEGNAFREFLSQGTVDGTTGVGELISIVEGGTTVNSEFTYNGLDFTLLQSLLPYEDQQGRQVGSILTQTYFVTNSTEDRIQFDLVRYNDGEINFRGIIPNVDGGGFHETIDRTQLLIETEQTTIDFSVSTNWVAITAEGGRGTVDNRFEMNQYLPNGNDLVERVREKEVLSDDVYNDRDDPPDLIIDLGRDYDVSSAFRNPFSLDPGQSDTYVTTTIWATLAPDEYLPQDLGGLRGTKFIDANANGIQDDGEVGLPGWTIFLDVNLNGQFDAGEPSTVTGNGGGYEFQDVAPGRYQVFEVQDPEWIQSAPANGFHSIVLGYAEIIEDLDFGNLQPGLSGRKWHDINANGVIDNGEPGIGGWEIYIDVDESGDLSPGDLTAITSPTGFYNFQDLPSDTYTVREVNRAHWRQITPDGDGSYTVDYIAGTSSTGLDFGNQELGNISGIKWHDVNQSGTLNAGEEVLANWEIYLDLNNDGALSPGDPSRLTNALGEYEFLDLIPGTYQVREVDQFNWEQTFPGTSSHSVQVVGGVTASNTNFGNKGFVSLGGYVFSDLNDNQIFEPGLGEMGIGGTWLYIDFFDDNHIHIGERSIISEPDGSYYLDRLEPGTFAIRQVTEPGWMQTGPVPNFEYLVTLAAGEELDDLNFSNLGLIDWGDAPVGYPTLAAEDGASHLITPGFQLGPGAPAEFKVDGESDGKPSALANGDDITDLDDEDGVVFGGSLISGTTGSVTVTAGPAQDTVKGAMSAWIDFNQDGDWDDAGEQIFTDVVLATGANALTFDIPVGAVGGDTFSRFRIAYERGLTPRGATESGEVEDHMLTIESPPVMMVTLETVVSEFMPYQNIEDEAWYEFTAAYTGPVTTEALFPHASGDIDIYLYDDSNNLLAQSTSGSDYERIDVDATIGDKFRLKLSGTNSQVDVRITNMVTQNSPLTIHGTEGNDVFEVRLGATTLEITTNGTSYTYNTADTESINFLGGGGSDLLTIIGTEEAETATMRPGEVTFQGVTGPLVEGSGIEEINVYGRGGADEVFMFDSAGDDVFSGRPTSSYMRGDDFLNRAREVERVTAYSSQGDDYAYLNDSAGDDQYVARPNNTYLTGDNFYYSVKDFFKTYGYSTVGGADIATLYGSTGDDRFIGKPGYSYMIGTDYHHSAISYERVYAHSVAGGNDSAFLYDSTANDLYVGRSTYSYMIGGNFHNNAIGFHEVTAFAINGGANKAIVDEVATSDTVTGQGDKFTIERDDVLRTLHGFDRIRAQAASGATPEADVSATDYFFEKIGSWL